MTNMGFDGWILTETALGVMQWADWAEPAGTDTGDEDFGSWTEAADDGGGPEDAAPPAAETLLTLGADMPDADLETLSAVAPAEAEEQEGAGPAFEDPSAGDLSVPETEGDDGDPVPDFYEPAFDFRTTGEAADGAVPPDGPDAGAPAAADPVAVAGLDDFTGDFAPPPDDSERDLPPGDVFPPLDEASVQVIADDGTILSITDLADPDFLL